MKIKIKNGKIRLADVNLISDCMLNNALARSGKGFIENYPDLAKKVESAMQAAIEKVESAFEPFSTKIEPLEHESRDGFISSNDGGYSAKMFCSLGSLVGGGAYKNFPSKAVDAIDRMVKISHDIAKDSFVEAYQKELKGIEKDKITYEGLSAAGHARLAESLAEYESESLSDDTVMLDLVAMMVRDDSGSGITFFVQGAVNHESPYHRRGSSNEVVKEITLYYDDEKEMEQSLVKDIEKSLASILKWMGA